MTIQEIKAFEGDSIQLTWLDRKGVEICDTAFLFEIRFVPLYGPCLITDKGEIRVERVLALKAADRIAA